MIIRHALSDASTYTRTQCNRNVTATLPLALTLWDHLIIAFSFALADFCIAYLFVAHLGPRLNGDKTKSILATERVILMEDTAKQTQKLLEAERGNLLTALIPDPEARAKAEEQARATLKATVAEVLAETAKGRMSAVGAAGAAARSERAAAEAEFKRLVLNHPKGGLAVAVGLNTLKRMDPDSYNFAVETAALAPEAVGEFLEKHAGKLTLGLGGKKEEKPQYMGA